MFDLSTLELALAGTIFAGKLHFSPVTDSTNTDALQAASAGAPHGSVYFADEQLARPWPRRPRLALRRLSGLYVSVLLRPPIPAARLPLMPLAAGLAAADAIHSVTGFKVDLRWPNDLLLGPHGGQRKVGASSSRPKPNPASSPTPSSASASMSTSAASQPTCPPLQHLSTIETGKSITPPAPARFPAKILAA